jgi:hypothetical protein
MPDRRSDLLRPSADGRRGADPLEQGLDRLVTAGRQLVDGVSGARPGSRAGRRAPRSADQPGGGRPRLGELGRWVEDKLEWILEDEDDWREPWQEPGPQPGPRRAEQPGRSLPARRRPLEAISRRGDRRRMPLEPPAAQADPAAAEADPWPDETVFSRPRWQRPAVDPRRAPDLSGEAARAAAARERESSRPLPRSSRRRRD